MDKITELRNDIAEMEEVFNSKATSQDIKDALKPSIDEAKKQLAEMEGKKSVEKSDVAKSNMSVTKMGKLDDKNGYKLGQTKDRFNEINIDSLLNYTLYVNRENTIDDLKLLQKTYKSFGNVYPYDKISAALSDAIKNYKDVEKRQMAIVKIQELVDRTIQLKNDTFKNIKDVVKPKTPKTVTKGLSALQKCQDLLAKYTNEKKTEQERIDKRKASGKPAELTPAETIKKAAKVVGNKIKDIKETDKKLTKSEITNIITGIESTILNTISAIVDVEDRKYFIEELIEYLKKLDSNSDVEIKNLLGEQYVDFVKILGENIKDKKFGRALRQLGKDNRVETNMLKAMAINMMPTQNEIDLDKSLKFPLKSPGDVRMYLTQKTPIKLGGNSVVTCNNTKYIVDGHHRWSQIYSINPNAEVSCLDLTDLKTPFDGLKASQMAIASDIEQVPTKPVKGINLITISESELKKYVNDNITNEVIEVLKEFEIDNPAEYIWGNIKKMQKFNQPVKNAPLREYMPQTDEAKNWQDYIPNVSKIESTNFKHGGEIKEHNIDMLHSLGTQMKHHTYELMKNIHKNDDVEAWVVAKAERAATDLSDITHYLDGEKKKFDRGGLINQYKAMASGGVVYPNLSDMKPSVVNDAPTYEKLYKKKGQLEIGEYAIQEVDLVKVGNKILSHDLVKDSESAVDILRKFWNKNSIIIRESAYAMFLNRANEVIAIYEVGIGGITGVVMDPELIASVAVKSLAKGVIIAHNHPSGNLMPSQGDKDVTNKIKQGLKFLDIMLLDHVIITENSYYSFADRGLL